jgi:hypothetical protein
MLGGAEQALWYINMAAAGVLFARLYAQGLVRAYPFLFAYLFAETLEQTVAFAFTQDRHIYTEIYFAGATVKVGLAILVIHELYELALAQQPVLARFNRRMLGYLFAIAVACVLVNLLLEFEDGGRKRYVLLVSFLRLGRSVDLFAFIALISIAGFLFLFPVRVRRNVAIWLWGFLLYSFSRWTGLLLTNAFPQLAHGLSVAMLAASLACWIGWSLMLNREGEKEIVVTGPFR